MAFHEANHPPCSCCGCHGNSAGNSAKRCSYSLPPRPPKNPTTVPRLLFPPLPAQQRLYHREPPRNPTPAPPLCLASRRFLSPQPHHPLSQILLCHLLFPVLATGCKSSMFRGMMALKLL